MLDILVVKPDVDFRTKFRAECPYCPVDRKGNRERSFPVVVKGQVTIGKVGEVINVGSPVMLADDPDADLNVLLKTGIDKVNK